jgi:LacI family transcriptional regulator
MSAMSRSFSRAVTIYDIAKQSGVSPAAVSSVLRNREYERRIAPKTAQHIREIANGMSYVPNMAGRRLRSSRFQICELDLAILTAFEAPLPLITQILYGLQKAVDVQNKKDAEYAVSIEMFHAGRLQEKSSLLSADRHHGVIITNTQPADDRFLEHARLPFPVVVLGRRIAGYCCVFETLGAVGRHAAEILLTAGCVKPVVFRGRLLAQTSSDRVELFTRTVREKTAFETPEVVCDGLLPRQAEAALENALACGLQLDALFAVTDSLAVGAYRALKRRGLKVPQDVAVVGVGDFEVAEYLDPPLTTVAGANDAMVAEAVPLLFRMLRGESELPKEIAVSPPIYIRESTSKKS